MSAVLVITSVSLLSVCLQSELVLRYEDPVSDTTLVGREVFEFSEIGSNCTAAATYTDGTGCLFYTIITDPVRHQSTHALCQGDVWKWKLGESPMTDIGSMPFYRCMIKDMKSILKKNDELIYVNGSKIYDYGFTITGWNANYTSRDYVPSGTYLYLRHPEYAVGTLRCTREQFDYFHPCKPFCGIGSTMSAWMYSEPVAMVWKPDCWLSPSSLSVAVTLHNGAVENFSSDYMRKYPLFFIITGDVCDYMSVGGNIPSGSECKVTLGSYTSEVTNCNVGTLSPARMLRIKPNGSTTQSIPSRLCRVDDLFVTIERNGTNVTAPVMKSGIPLDCSSEAVSCRIGSQRLACVDEVLWSPTSNVVIKEMEFELVWTEPMSVSDLIEAGNIVKNSVLGTTVPVTLKCPSCSSNTTVEYIAYTTGGMTADELSQQIWNSKDKFSNLASELIGVSNIVGRPISTIETNTAEDPRQEGSGILSYAGLMLLFNIIVVMVI